MSKRRSRELVWDRLLPTTPAGTFAYKLLQQMKRRNMTVAELSAASGVTFVSIYRYVNHWVDPKLQQVTALAQALSVDTGMLMPDPSAPPPTTPTVTEEEICKMAGEVDE